MRNLHRVLTFRHKPVEDSYNDIKHIKINPLTNRIDIQVSIICDADPNETLLRINCSIDKITQAIMYWRPFSDDPFVEISGGNMTHAAPIDAFAKYMFQDISNHIAEYNHDISQYIDRV
jgi:hypothetical protein